MTRKDIIEGKKENLEQLSYNCLVESILNSVCNVIKNSFYISEDKRNILSDNIIYKINCEFIDKGIIEPTKQELFKHSTK